MVSIFISIIISAGVAAYYYTQQKKYYKENMAKLEKAKEFFLETSQYKIVEVNGEKTISVGNVDGELKILINELNKYISRNKGTTDFSVIQNKTERFSNTIYEDAVSNIAFPTYMGLQGTFIGVFIGLLGFVLPNLIGISSDEESDVSRLVIGVVVSMVTSFWGLWYTTKSNKIATINKKIMDERKNQFYDFVQNELMPVLGTSVVAALNQLKETLLNFHTQFDVITNKFKTTFDGCTDKFGKEFEKNIVAVASAADKLGSSISLVNENVKNQQALLKELRSEGMIQALNRFIVSGKQFKEATESIENMTTISQKLDESISNLMDVQRDYCNSLVVPKLIAERLNLILTRVTTFEQSVNALGSSVSQTQMLGNSEMRLIEQHLENIKRKNDIAVEYQELANEELKRLFDEETQIIKNLHSQYTEKIVAHGEEFQMLMETVYKAIRDKKQALVEELDRAFNIAELHTELSHLKKLPEIQKEISETKSMSTDYYVASKKYAEAKLGKLDSMNEKIDSLKDSFVRSNSAVKEIVERMNLYLTEIKQNVGDIVEKDSYLSELSGKAFVRIEAEIISVEDKLSTLSEKMNDVSVYDTSSLKEISESLAIQKTQIDDLNNSLLSIEQNVSVSLEKNIEERIVQVAESLSGIDSAIDNLNKKLTSDEQQQ